MLNYINRKYVVISSFVSIFFISSGCNRTAIDKNHQTSLEIENSINLPKDSKDVRDYSRYYALGGNGIVEAVFVIHAPGRLESIKRFCAESGTKSFPCNDKNFGVAEPGSSKWLDSPEYLPAQSGGGCGHIYIKYDSEKSQFLDIRCNDPY